MVLLYLNRSSHLSNAFNGHFSSVGPKLANDIPISNNHDHCHMEYVKDIKIDSSSALLIVDRF